MPSIPSGIASDPSFTGPEPDDLAAAETRAAEEVAGIAQHLIRIDTSNDGTEDATGERPAAEYAADLLSEAGAAPEILVSGARRANVVARIEGSDPQLGGLLLHGHLDVVPARAADWSRGPFSGEIADEAGVPVLWGRGALDMKGTVAAFVAAFRQLARSGRRPRRTVVLALFADEEGALGYGAHWVAKQRPEVLAGVSEAITEGGGQRLDVAGRPVYTVVAGEKAFSWLRLRARGTAGHGSLRNTDNAVTRLAAALTRIGTHQWPLRSTPVTTALLTRLAEFSGLPLDLDDEDAVQRLVEQTGPLSSTLSAALRTVSNPTGLTAGYKPNVIPSEAEGTIDVRIPAGFEDEADAELRRLIGEGIDVETIGSDRGTASPFPAPATEAIAAAVQREDPTATLLPFVTSGGTDNKALRPLGIQGYGFAPARYPDGFDPGPLVHGVDERVPLETLRVAARVSTALVASV
jgi:acetylornithine deacetylase/succinyl-diaminopimelate desuccinylase-like protein